MKTNYDDPNDVYYKVHDVCTDIKEGIISDGDATDQLVTIFEQQLHALAEQLLNKAAPDKKHNVDRFVSFLSKTIDHTLLEVSV